MRDAEKTISNLIDKQSTVYLSSIDEEGYPNCKAMFSPRKREGIHKFYLTTNYSSLRVKQLLDNHHACLYFSDKRFFRGVMLKGTINVLTDSASKESIWLDTDTKFYPQGVQDPDYCVLEFTAISARYYANFSSQDFAIT